MFQTVPQDAGPLSMSLRPDVPTRPALSHPLTVTLAKHPTTRASLRKARSELSLKTAACRQNIQALQPPRVQTRKDDPPKCTLLGAPESYIDLTILQI